MLKWLSKLWQKDSKGEKKRVMSACSDKHTATEISKINSVEVRQDVLHSVSKINEGKGPFQSYGPLNPQCHEQWRKNEKQCPEKITNSYYISTENSMKDVEVSTNDIDIVNPGYSKTFPRQNCLFHPVPVIVYPKQSTKEFKSPSNKINNVGEFLANSVPRDDCTKVSNSEVNTGNVITENGVVSLDNVVKRSSVNSLENGSGDCQTASSQSNSDIHLQKNGQTLISNVVSPCSFNTVHYSSFKRCEDLPSQNKSIHNPINRTVNNFSENTIDIGSRAENVKKRKQQLKIPNKRKEKKTSLDTKLNSENSTKVNYQNEKDQEHLMKQLPVSVNTDQDNLVSDTTVKPKESLIAIAIFSSSVKERSKKKDEMSMSMSSKISTPVNPSKCEGLLMALIPKTLDNADAQPKLCASETNDTQLGYKNELEVEKKLVAQYQVVEGLKNSSQIVSALYNHEGEICTMFNQRYIRTILTNSSKIVYVHIKVRDIKGFGTKIGCLILWRGQSPIPLSIVKDGSKVKFDAILMPDVQVFHALVIWDFDLSKPKFVTEPSIKSYLWIDSRILLCEDMVIEATKSRSLVHLDQEEIWVEFSENVLYLYGKRASFSELKLHHATSLEPIYAMVCRLLTARNGGEFLYVCSCVWSGLRPTNYQLPTKQFRRGEIYRLNANNTFVPDSNPYRLYCDWPAELNMTQKKCLLQFEIEDYEVLQSLTTNEIFTGNHRAKPCLPLNVQVTAHIQMLSESKWVVWQVQLPTNETDSDIPSEKVHTKPENEECSKPMKSIPFENKQVLSDLPRKFAKKCHPTKKTSLNVKRQTAVLNDATGNLICVKGNYGILGIRHKRFGVSGEVWVSFHRSVAYVDRLPFYKDVSFDEQMEDLLSYTWHCSISRKDHIVDDLSLKYEAALAWQGQKPTKEDLEYFRSEPSDVYYYAASNTQDTLESLVFYNSNRDISAQELTRASSACTSKVEGTITVFSSTESLPTDETQNLAVDDMDLFPTLALDEERDIVEVRSPKRKGKFK